MPSSDEWWAIDGQSLHEYGWSVATVGGSRYDLPPRRGANLVLPYRPGQVFQPKLADSRTISLVMWVVGLDPATGADTGDHRLRWNDSWDYLRRLVWKVDGQQFTLTRRWLLTGADNVPHIVVAEAQAELAGTMAPTMTGRFRADFTMDLLLADPYFYGPVIEHTLQPGDAITIHNPGHDIAAYGHLEIELQGTAGAPRITNLSTSPPVWVEYTGPGNPATSTTLDIGGFQAIYHSTPTAFDPTAFEGDVNVIGSVAHSGARHWMGLLPGDNAILFTGSGQGTATLRFRPPYV